METAALVWGLLISLSVCAVLVIYIIRNSRKEYEKKAEAQQYYNELKIAQMRLRQGEEYYRTMRDNLEQVSLIRYDLSHHFRMISEYCRCGQYDKILSYLDELDFQKMAGTVQTYCENHAANLILGYYAGKAGDNQIEFTCQADLPEGIPGNTMDLSVLLGNALENALEACADVEGRKYIEIKMRYEKSKLLLCIRNSYQNPLRFQDGGLMSHKQEAGHGLGMKSIQRVVNKYEGYCNYYGEKGEFVLQIVLQTEAGDVLQPVP